MTNGRVATACPLPWFAVPLSGHPGRRPGIHGLAAAPEQASNVLRAGWIPACAGKTKRFVIPGEAQRRPGIHRLAAAPERTSNVFRAEWIPTYAGMTKRLVIPGEDPGSTGWRKRLMSDRTSNVIRAGWIPACAGMTNGKVGEEHLDTDCGWIETCSSIPRHSASGMTSAIGLRNNLTSCPGVYRGHKRRACTTAAISMVGAVDTLNNR